MRAACQPVGLPPPRPPPGTCPVLARAGQPLFQNRDHGMARMQRAVMRRQRGNECPDVGFARSAERPVKEDRSAVLFRNSFYIEGFADQAPRVGRAGGTLQCAAVAAGGRRQSTSLEIMSSTARRSSATRACRLSSVASPVSRKRNSTAPLPASDGLNSPPPVSRAT